MPYLRNATPPSLESSKQSEHGNYTGRNPEQAGCYCNHPDCPLLKSIEALAERLQLAFHAIMPVLASYDDLQREQSTVKRRDAVLHCFPARIAVLGQNMRLVGWRRHAHDFFCWRVVQR